MALDRGGGERGEGGSLVQSEAPNNPLDNRNQKNYRTGTLLRSGDVESEEDDLDSTPVISQYIIKAINDDTLTVKRFANGSETGNFKTVAKPIAFRKTIFDGKTFEDRKYTYLDNGGREIDRGGGKETWIEILLPDYEVGELINAQEVDDTDIDGVSLLDLNTNGRRWAIEDRRMVIKNPNEDIDDDFLTCRSKSNDGTIGDEDIYVLKPWTLRRTPFDGKTVNNITYDYDSNTERNAEDENGDDVDEIITPDYWEEVEILVEKTARTVLLSNGSLTNWLDKNNDSRSWARNLG